MKSVIYLFIILCGINNNFAQDISLLKSSCLSESYIRIDNKKEQFRDINLEQSIYDQLGKTVTLYKFAPEPKFKSEVLKCEKELEDLVDNFENKYGEGSASTEKFKQEWKEKSEWCYFTYISSLAPRLQWVFDIPKNRAFKLDSISVDILFMPGAAMGAGSESMKFSKEEYVTEVLYFKNELGPQSLELSKIYDLSDKTTFQFDCILMDDKFYSKNIYTRYRRLMRVIFHFKENGKSYEVSTPVFQIEI